MTVPVMAAILGLLGIAAEMAATLSNAYTFQERSKLRSRSFWGLTTAVGFLLFFGSLYVEYPIGREIRAFGVPFLIGILQFERGRLGGLCLFVDASRPHREHDLYGHVARRWSFS